MPSAITSSRPNRFVTSLSPSGRPSDRLHSDDGPTESPVLLAGSPSGKTHGMSTAMMPSPRDRDLDRMRRIAVPPQPDSGSVFQPIASMTDISERLTLEAALAATNAQLAFHRLVADVAARIGTIAPEE